MDNQVNKKNRMPKKDDARQPEKEVRSGKKKASSRSLGKKRSSRNDDDDDEDVDSRGNIRGLIA